MLRLSSRQIIQEDCQRVVTNAQSLQSLSGDTVLITGGTGFIGTWVAELAAFLNDQHQLNLKIILLARHPNNLATQASHLSGRSDIQFVEKDVRSILDIAPEVNWIIHAAATPDNRVHASDPLSVIEVIAQGTKAVLSAASRLPNLKKIVNISSGLVYGPQPHDLPGIPESYRGGVDCSAVSAAYAEAKRLAETLGSVYRNQHKLPVVNVRPFAFIGPYQHLDRPWAINNFIRDSLIGGPIRILGDGQTVRSYMYAADMAWWLWQILVHGKVGQNYNIGSPQGVTLQEVASKVANNFPVPLQIISRGLDDGLHRSVFVPDTQFASNSLNLELATELDGALKRTMSWHQYQQ